MLLDATTHSLEVATSSAQSLDYFVEWADHTASDAVLGSSQGNIASATTTTVVAAPAASTQRQVKYLSLLNRGTAENAVIVKKDISGTEREMSPPLSLQAGEVLQWTLNDGFSVVDRSGRRKQQASDLAGGAGKSLPFYKVGTVAEAAGSWYCWAKDTGFPGAWVPGTPGLNGRATDGTQSADAGCINPGTPGGAWYITKFELVGSVAHHSMAIDLMWVNSGLVVTTTTAQAITPVALPARDAAGSTNGEGVMAGLLVTTATTNGSAVTNCTISYTNSDGTAGRTGTMASFPATAVVGTIVPFELAAGDIGVRSVQSVTLGTSLVTGAVSLALFRILDNASMLTINVGSPPRQPSNPGIRLYNGSCILLAAQVIATTANTITGTLQVMDR